MLSRRNVRVKVMQVLYAQSRDESLSDKQVIQSYWMKIEDSFELLLFSLYNIIQIAKVASDDNVKDVQNTYLQNWIKIWAKTLVKFYDSSSGKNKTIQGKFQKLGFASKVDKDHFRTIYFDFSKEEIYSQYILKPTVKDDDLEILLELFRFCRRNEIFNEIIEDQYANWEDDKSIIIGTIKKYSRICLQKMRTSSWIIIRTKRQ